MCWSLVASLLPSSASQVPSIELVVLFPACGSMGPRSCRPVGPGTELEGDGSKEKTGCSEHHLGSLPFLPEPPCSPELTVRGRYPDFPHDRALLWEGHWH